MATGPNALWICQLPSMSRNDQGRIRTLWTEFSIEAFATEPNADLIVFFELYVIAGYVSASLY